MSGKQPDQAEEKPDQTNAELLRKVVERLDNVSKTQEMLLQALTSVASSAVSVDNLSLLPVPSRPSRSAATDTFAQNTANIDVDSIHKDSLSAFSYTLDEQSEANESLFVHTPLPKEQYSTEGFKEHLRKFPWPETTIEVLDGLFEEPDLYTRDSIFPASTGPQPDNSHNTYYSIYDVGADGAPLPVWVNLDAKEKEASRSLQIWNRICQINTDSHRERQAVGRITILREPSPLLFAAAHYTHHKYMDVDEMIAFMLDDNPILAHPHRAFDSDERLRRSFSWTFEYFTIIGEDCKPMSWQFADLESNLETHVPIGRCSAAVALSLEGPPVAKVKNKDRRALKDKRIGDVYDPFAPWRVLVLTAFPDWRSTTDTFSSSKHVANGPEAFIVALLSEYKDVRKRLQAVYDAVSDLVEPPTDFIFHQDTRDTLLFEDENFTYSRRYFWAFQTLDIMNQDIEEMVNAYRNSFKDSVWNGTNKIIWPGEETQSSRYTAWRKRMRVLRQDFEFEVKKLEEMEALNSKKIKAIKALRDNLFSGTSVMESRRSIQMAELTIKQGNNIKLLTLITIFFLPLTFVTSVYGMTNMDQNASFLPFAWTVLAICIPTYVLIGSLNSATGLEFWSHKTRVATTAIGRSWAWVLNHVFKYYPKWTHKYANPEAHALMMRGKPTNRLLQRSWSEQNNMLKRKETIMPNGRAAPFSRTATVEAPTPGGRHVPQRSNSSSVQLPKVTSFPLKKPAFSPPSPSSNEGTARLHAIRRAGTFDAHANRVESPTRAELFRMNSDETALHKMTTFEEKEDESSKSSEVAKEDRQSRPSMIERLFSRRKSSPGPEV